MTTGERLKELREARGLSQEYVGKYIGTSKQNIYKYEAGIITNIPLDRLERMAELFDVSPGYITGWLDEFNREDFDDIPGLSPAPAMKKREIVGATACGDPVHREIYDQEIFAPADINADAVYRCDGESMIGARIYDGDLVFIKFDAYVDNGGIYLVQVDDEYTLKRVYLDSEEIRLVSENPKERTRVYSGPAAENVKVIGKAVYFMAPVE